MSHISPRGEQSTSTEIATLTALTNLAVTPAGQAIAKTGTATFTNRATVTSNGYQQPLSGVVDGVNTAYVFATAPNVMVVDWVPLQKMQADGITTNWDGTTTIVLKVAPTNHAYAIA